MARPVLLLLPPFLPASSGIKIFGSPGRVVAEILGPGSSFVGVRGQTRGIPFAAVEHTGHCQGDMVLEWADGASGSQTP